MPLSIQALLHPNRYAHPVRSIQVVETHISWVLLTGDYAYKIKKPLNLGFLDFSSLNKRHHYCLEELRLNRRLAPGIYLEVVPITGTPDAPSLRDQGVPIDYAVKMRQFPQEGLLDHMLARGNLTPQQVDNMARLAGKFHAHIDTAPKDSDFGSPAWAHLPTQQNFQQILQLESSTSTREHLQTLQDCSERIFKECKEIMTARKDKGFIRECHGDMHLGNMAEIDGHIVIFDGIEFNDHLRWIDVISEIAFLFTDFKCRGRPDYAWRVLNTYLEVTGDFAGLALLRYYQIYRIMVRAKVARIRLSQSDLSPREHTTTETEFRDHLRQAEDCTRKRKPMLILMRGISGCGKSHLARLLLEAMGAICIRSDVERKRLFSLAANERSGSSMHTGIYTPEANRQTLARLLELTQAVLAAGLTVIVDATFLDRTWRQPFRELADTCTLPFVIIDIHIAKEILARRVRQREKNGDDASEAGPAVVSKQLDSYQPLDKDELDNAIPVDNDKEPNIPHLTSLIESLTQLT